MGKVSDPLSRCFRMCSRTQTTFLFILGQIDSALATVVIKTVPRVATRTHAIWASNTCYTTFYLTISHGRLNLKNTDI